MAHLVLTRHGESQFNAKSLWTGTWDVPLTKQGRHEAKITAHHIKDMKPAVAFTSVLSRATETLSIILAENHWKPKVVADPALNERDYGDLTGMNKWTVEEQYGEEQFNKWRRGWDERVPEGETLKKVFQRVVPYYEKRILPELEHGHNVLITAHGNSLRALIKYLDGLDNRQIQSLEMPWGEVIVYDIDKHGKVAAKDVRRLHFQAPPA